MKNKICLLTDHHISLNPRLWKEAFFYEKKGYEVVILSMWQFPVYLEKDFELLKGHRISYKPYLNLLPGEINRSGQFFFRLRKRLAGELQKWFSLSTKWAISYSPSRMVAAALKEEANLYLAHLECAFYAGKKLCLAGKKVSFDFEDWYSRDYLVPERPVSLLTKLEAFALQHGEFISAASGSMAKALMEVYKATKKIEVIYNGFPNGQQQAESLPYLPAAKYEYIRLLWFSRTIGPERGLEDLLAALTVCEKPVELHLLGEMVAGYQIFLDEQFAGFAHHKLVVHAFLQPALVPGFIRQFRVGLAIEENINENKSLTISNKILQYLQGGLQVIASDTKGQREVADYFPERVSIVDIKDKAVFSRAIMSSDNNIGEMSKDEEEKFTEIFSWEAQEKKLAKLIAQIEWV